MVRSPHILILTNPADFHSFVIAEALSRKGAAVSLWHGTDFPGKQTASLAVEDDLEQWEVTGPELSIEERASAVWLRRPGQPVLPACIDPADRQFASVECMSFLNGLYRHAGRGAFWVNPPESFSRARLKTEQIRSACRVGLKIPRTLFSNDPAKIRQFLRANPRGVLYKSFYPASWQREDGVAVLFSAPVGEADLPADMVLSATPGIFQEIVPKAYELRITAIGKRMFAARLDSQAVPSARTDFRAASTPVPIEPAELPPRIASACQAMMVDLGIVFGCFDLIVTPAGEYVFLEVNEMGAFLWIEEQNPAIRLIDPFCELLIQGRSDFLWSESDNTLRLEEIRSAALQRMRSAAGAHITKPSHTPADSPRD